MTAVSRKSRFVMKLKGFKKKGKGKKEKKNRTVQHDVSARYNTPERSRTMPSEIEIKNGISNSPMSQVSGATDLIDKHPIPIAHSMMRSALPTLETDSVQSNSLHATSQMTFDFPESKRQLKSPPSNNKGRGRVTTRSFVDRSKFFHNELKGKGSRFFSKSERFQQLVKSAFESIDTDQSGAVDKKELYSGLILIHLQLAAYVGPAACRPATREQVEEIFDKLDQNGSGTLDFEEFGVVMTLLVSHIMTRVVLQLSMTLMIVPLVAQFVLEICVDVSRLMKIIVKEIDDAELLTERIYWFLMNVINFIIPAGIKTALLAVGQKIDEIVPDDAYDTLPMTIVSCFLGTLLVPLMLYKIDTFYDWVASSWKKEPTRNHT